MTLYYSIVFGILSTEVFAFFLFLLPVPTRWQKPVFRWLATSPAVAHLQYIMKIVFVFIFVLFLDSVNTLRAFYEVVSEDEQGVPAVVNSDFKAEVSQAAKKFYAQRNLYLTGFTILLLLILNKIKSMSLDYIELEDNFIQLEASVSNDPQVKAAAEELDTSPIDRNVTKLVPVEQPTSTEESKKDI